MGFVKQQNWVGNDLVRILFGVKLQFFCGQLLVGTWGVAGYDWDIPPQNDLAGRKARRIFQAPRRFKVRREAQMPLADFKQPG